jgi:hypothetical protein
MQQIRRNILAALLGVALLLLPEALVQGGESSGKISSLLLKKMEQMALDAQLGYTEYQLSERHSSKFVFVDDQARIYVRVSSQEESTELIGSEITAMGGVVLNSSDKETYCLLRYDVLTSLAEINGVLSVSIGPVPQTRTGSVNTAGDGQLFADKARDLFYANGNGIKVGVISDGMQFWANSAATGDLPSFIGVVDQSDQRAGSEGTAMMEIVYDLAP